MNLDYFISELNNIRKDIGYDGIIKSISWRGEIIEITFDKGIITQIFPKAKFAWHREAIGEKK